MASEMSFSALLEGVPRIWKEVEALKLIKDRATTSSSSGGVIAVKSAASGKVSQRLERQGIMANWFTKLKGLSEDAKKKRSALAGDAQFSKVQG